MYSACSARSNLSIGRYSVLIHYMSIRSSSMSCLVFCSSRSHFRPILNPRIISSGHFYYEYSQCLCFHGGNVFTRSKAWFIINEKGSSPFGVRLLNLDYATDCEGVYLKHNIHLLSLLYYCILASISTPPSTLHSFSFTNIAEERGWNFFDRH